MRSCTLWKLQVIYSVCCYTVQFKFYKIFFMCVISVPCCWLQHNEQRDRKCLYETAGPGSDQESRQSEDTAEGTMSQEPVHRLRQGMYLLMMMMMLLYDVDNDDEDDN